MTRKQLAKIALKHKGTKKGDALALRAIRRKADLGRDLEKEMVKLFKNTLDIDYFKNELSRIMEDAQYGLTMASKDTIELSIDLRDAIYDATGGHNYSGLDEDDPAEKAIRDEIDRVLLKTDWGPIAGRAFRGNFDKAADSLAMDNYEWDIDFELEYVDADVDLMPPLLDISIAVRFYAQVLGEDEY